MKWSKKSYEQKKTHLQNGHAFCKNFARGKFYHEGNTLAIKYFPFILPHIGSALEVYMEYF